METIHFKTVDPVSQELLRGASQRGIELNWERYEKQQPQDGFLRLGLSCPYGCMQGPCRIDPYGRGADRGICGLDRDSMAAAFLLRLTLQGLWEGTDPAPASRRGAEIVWPAPLEKMAAAALNRLGGAPLSVSELGESAMMLSRPSASSGGACPSVAAPGASRHRSRETGEIPRIPGVPSRIRTSGQRGDHDRGRRQDPRGFGKDAPEGGRRHEEPESASGIAR